MEQFIYAQLDKDGYCCGISQLAGEVDYDNMVRIDSYDMSYLEQKYDGVWTGEYRPKPEPKPQEPTQLDRIEESLIDNTLETQYVASLIELGI